VTEGERKAAIEAFLALPKEQQEALRTAEKSARLDRAEAKKRGGTGRKKVAALNARNRLAGKIGRSKGPQQG
jgi:hypothetical protein